MNEVDKAIEWQNGGGETVKIGFVNSHGQRCCGHCGIEGTDHGQHAYKTECTRCGYVYGANGTDMYERLCPECQGGAPGIRYWRRIEQLSLHFEAGVTKIQRADDPTAGKRTREAARRSSPLLIDSKVQGELK